MNIEDMEKERVQVEIAKLMADTMRINRETEKLSKELKWYEVTIIIAATLAIVAVAKLFL